ncbi:MAG: hypothetical protein ABIN67_10650 [Ferruginibacter sp.]
MKIIVPGKKLPIHFVPAIFLCQYLPPPKVQVPAKARMLESYGIGIALCPKCKLETMELIATFNGVA